MTLLLECVDNESSLPYICLPSTCGPNSDCFETPNGPMCKCKQGYSGTPPHCRPECTTNADCPGNKACAQYRCVDPCTGSCAAMAECYTVNHLPVCKCPVGQSGDPFSSCFTQSKTLFKKGKVSLAFNNKY
ncbi:coagulation factor XII-like [Halyomorpha halys]|uniref:coagulation factor XII-like n=1 Tax=Halyomorpha halys TaxID=286706 RepID=UPI0006D4ECF6|nr:transmembrane cell adhesion receptor mua-3-like [Halyomorpha halys]